MQYASLRDRLVQTISSHPGLVTKQVYEQLGATSVGDQSHIRSSLRKMTKSKMFQREQRVSGSSGPPTFAYFPGPKLNGAGRPQLTTTPQEVVQVVRTATPTATPATGTVTAGTMLATIARFPTGISTAKLYKELGINGRPGKMMVARRTLTTLTDLNKVYRCREVGGKGTGQGAKPYVYFPRSAEAKQAMAEYRLSKPVKKARRQTTKVSHPSVSTAAPTRIEMVPGGTLVEQVVRINLPNGQQELTTATARQLYNELGTLFA